MLLSNLKMGKKNQNKLSGFHELRYRFIIGSLEVFMGLSNVSVTLLPVTMIYFMASGSISLILGYEPFMMPPLLRLWVLLICFILLFIIGDKISKKARKLQKEMEEKIGYTRDRYNGDFVFVSGQIFALALFIPLSIGFLLVIIKTIIPIFVKIN